MRDDDSKTRTRLRPPAPDNAEVARNKAAAESATRVKAPGAVSGGAADHSRASGVDAKASGEQTRFRPSSRQQGQRTQTRVRSPARGEPPQGNAQPSHEPADHRGGATPRVLKGRFILEKVLGVGGMGVVYKAKDRLKVEAQDKDPYVAIKVLSEEFKTHPEAFIALQRESRKAQRISHHNTVRVYDFDRDGDIVFMTMEYLEGRPLDQIIQQYHATGLPRDDAWRILGDMCSALSQAHKENIVHSDFKPGNVFVTDAGLAKVFDFGIARAVASIDRKAGGAQDRTVFDAGTLGALTPAYASAEMLQGQKPDVRDDIYALGCIAYEMLTGEHPFKKLPADEAAKRNLRPKRINDISKAKWRAIEGALAFKRQERTATVEQFYAQLTTRKKPRFLAAASILLVAAGGAYAYSEFYRVEKPDVSQTDIRSELEFEISYKFHKEKIQKLMASASFSPDWESSLWEEIQDIRALLEGQPDPWLQHANQAIYELYIERITKAIEQAEFALAQRLLSHAGRYTNNLAVLEGYKQKLAKAKQAAEAQRREREQQRMARARQAEQQQAREVKEQRRTDLFNLALKNVNQQLECSAKLNMRDFKIAINKLRSLNQARYKGLEGGVIKRLAGCITAIGETFPERARDYKKYAMLLFDSAPKIASIHIPERDACDISLAGLGARGDRSVCRDKLANGKKGPAMVVIPEGGRLEPVAISKYEISIREFNAYCRATGSCRNRSGRDSLPVTNVSVQTAKAYLRWLSGQTKKKYRLPTLEEWKYAATARSGALDPNRNCRLSSRGIQKGGELVSINAGQQNDWGLVNHVGNVQEWVYNGRRSLLVAGGSYRSSMSDCRLTTASRHDGNPDPETGFRVVRELEL